MTLDEEITLCIDMLLFINRKELEGENEVGVKIEKSDGDEPGWTLEFRDFNDEELFSVTKPYIEDTIHAAVGQLRSKIMDESNEAMKLLERSVAFKYAEVG